LKEPNERERIKKEINQERGWLKNYERREIIGRKS
jgi:hypothetical protein